MYQLNPLLLIESKFTKMLPYATSIGGAIGMGARGAIRGGAIGTGIGGISHLIKKDHDLDNLKKTDIQAYKKERRHRLKKRLLKGLKRGAITGGAIGGTVGALGGYHIGKQVGEPLEKTFNKKHKLTTSDISDVLDSEIINKSKHKVPIKSPKHKAPKPDFSHTVEVPKKPAVEVPKKPAVEVPKKPVIKPVVNNIPKQPEVQKVIDPEEIARQNRAIENLTSGPGLYF